MAQDALIRIRAKVDGQAEVQALERQFRRTESQTQKLRQSFSGLATVAARLGGAFAVFQGLRFTLIKTAELQTQTKSLEVLTGSLEQAQTVIKELQEFGAVTPFTSSELIQTAKLLKAYNIDTAKLVDTTKRLGDVAGATGGDLEGIARAFGQIQSRGSLQAEELNQLRERGVDIETALRDAYDLSGAEFADAMRNNQISAEAVFAILERITSEGGKYAGGAISQSTTLAGKFSTLQDNVDQLARAFGQQLTPAVEGVLDKANELVQGLTKIDPTLGLTALALGGVTAAAFALKLAFDKLIATKIGAFLVTQINLFNTFGARIYFVAGAQAALNLALKAMPVGIAILALSNLIQRFEDAKIAQDRVTDAINSGSKERIKSAIAMEEETISIERNRAAKLSMLNINTKLLNSQKRLVDLRKALADLGDGPAPDAQTPPVPVPDLGGPDGDGLAEEENRLEKLKKAYDKFKDSALVAQAARDNAAQNAVQKIQDEINIGRIRLEQGDEYANKFKEVRDLLLAGVPFSEAFGLVEAKANLAALQEEADNLAAAQEAQAQKLDDLYKNIGSTIANGIGGAIEGLIDGTKTLGESLSGILRQLGSMFMQFGIQNIVGSFFPSANGNVFAQNKVVPFAYGGVVNKPTLFPLANGTGLMAEQGPEAIMPLRRSRSGRLGVEAAGGGAANVTVNVDASGSSVQGDSNQAAQLGKAIGLAVQAEMIKQKRPGGLLAGV